MALVVRQISHRPPHALWTVHRALKAPERGAKFNRALQRTPAASVIVCKSLAAGSAELGR